jgi:hypothetical protein
MFSGIYCRIHELVTVLQNKGFRFFFTAGFDGGYITGKIIAGSRAFDRVFSAHQDVHI